MGKLGKLLSWLVESLTFNLPYLRFDVLSNFVKPNLYDCSFQLIVEQLIKLACECRLCNGFLWCCFSLLQPFHFVKQKCGKAFSVDW